MESLGYKRKKRFLTHLRLEIKKLCVVRTYVDMDELLTTTIEVEKVLSEIGETPYEPLKDEKNEELIKGETSIDWHIHALNETLIIFFKGLGGNELVTHEIPRSSSVCQLCNMVGHSAYMCSKLYDRPKCGKCVKVHKTKKLWT